MGESSRPATRVVAQFVHDVRFDALPERVIPAARLAILDLFGVALAATQQPVGRIIAEHVRSLGGEPVARVFGADFRTSPPMAALANGTLAHALDFDDRGHVSTHTLPAALAVGEMVGASGARLLEAYAAGREVGIRLTEAVEARRKAHGGPTFRGWYRVGVVGPIAAAVTAAKVLALDTQGIQVAIGLAATSAGGLRRNQGTMAKALHAGNAASDGVHAALLAQRGFTADPEILESPLGYLQALCLPGELDDTPLLDRLGKPFDLELTPEIKPFPACSPSHKPLEAMLALKRQHDLRVEDVEAIEADFHTFSLFRLDPQEAIATGFSLPYLLAVALIDGKVGIDQVSEARLYDPLVRQVMTQVRPAAESDGDDGAERVSVVLRDGRRLHADVKRARNLTTLEETEAKFRDASGRALDQAAVERLFQVVMRLEQVGDVRELMDAAAR